MNKILFSISLLLIVLARTNCQEDFSPKLTFGVRGGISHSNVYFDPGILSKFINVPGGGVFINYISQPCCGVQIEMNYVARGWTEKTDSTGSYYREMRFLEFPFLSHFEIGKKLVKVTIDIGPYIAFQQSFYEEYDPTLRVINTDDSVIYGEKNYYGIDAVKNYDYGFLGGLGLGFNTKAGIFSIDFRFSQGMVNVLEKYPKGNFSFSTNQSYFIGLSYSYAIKLKAKKKNYKISG